jgi:hypothetical protein
MQVAGRGKVLVQGKSNRYPQICSFTACDGGVSGGISSVGNVEGREEASQCGVCCRWGVLALLAGLLLLVKKGQEIGCVRVCVCERRSETHGKSWSVSHSSSSAVVMHGADIVVRFSNL